MLRPLVRPLVRALTRSPMESRGLRPTLSLDFTNGGVTDSRITYSGGANGTRVNSAGVIVAATTPRFDYNPVTLAPLGLLVEEQRTNLLLNNTTLSTQNATTAATPYTLSFYGTGTVTLSGTSTAGPLVGTSAYPNRVTLTFTPTAGTLTLTVSGSVQYAQLEAGSFATSVIINAGSALTRTADSAVMTGTNFSSWFNASEGTFIVGLDCFANDANDNFILSATDSSDDEQYRLSVYASTLFYQVQADGVNQVNMSLGAITTAPTKAAVAFFKANDFAACVNGGTVSTDASGSVAAPDRMGIGGIFGGDQLNGHIRSIRYYPRRLPNATLQGMTA